LRYEREAVMTKLEAWRWKIRRILFRVGLYVLALPLAVYYGPNLVLMGRLTTPTPADFVPIVESRCISTVRAIKEYQRDTGHLPGRLTDLGPKYLRSIPMDQSIAYGQFRCPAPNGCIYYILSPPMEGWQVFGDWVDGPIPLPNVEVAPSTGPIPPSP
jgi:hypothetical protein